MNTDTRVMRSLRFRQEREAQWLALEAILDRADRKGRAALTPEECLSLPRLYQSSLSALSVARAISLDPHLIAYLEGLSLKAHVHVHGVSTPLWSLIYRFFTQDWPQAVRLLWRPIMVAALVFCLSWAIGHSLVIHNTDWFYTLMSNALNEDRSPTASKAFLRGALFESQTSTLQSFSVFAAFLFNNNATVMFMGFGLGFALGIPTLGLLFFNGAMGGALSAVYARQGLIGDLYGWLWVHGSTEITAIVIGAGAGLHIGAAIAFPNQTSRRAALKAAGHRAAVVAMGCVIMLFVAGILEGFVRQGVQSTAARYAIGFIMFGIWIGYFYAAGRQSSPRMQAE